jgi:hypothetical protein
MAEQRFTVAWLHDLVSRGEGTLVEFKSKWYDIAVATEKAKFLKSMLAMGNTVSRTETGFILVGVDDARRGGAIRGVTHSSTPEAVSQVLSSLTTPPVRHELHRIAAGTAIVDVLEVMLAPSRPHHAVRELPELRCDVAYIRRGPTIGTMMPPELEAMYRERFDHMRRLEQEPLELAFISHDNWYCGGKIVARITNRTREPVADVRGGFEIVMTRVPGARDRREVVSGGPLQAGESRNLDLDLYQFPVIHNSKPLSPNGNLIHRAVDITLVVQYRDKGGGLRTIREGPLSLAQ